MQVTHTVDESTGMVQMVMHFSIAADPDRASDVAWGAVAGILRREQLERGIEHTPREDAPPRDADVVPIRREAVSDAGA